MISGMQVRATFNMKIERRWAMPSPWTFTIKPIAEMIADEVHHGFWCDPFAGRNSPAQVSNDINCEHPTVHHLDALAFLRLQKNECFDGVLFDPPYSITQAKECYNGHGIELLNVKPTSMKYWSECKNEIARITKRGELLSVLGGTQWVLVSVGALN